MKKELALKIESVSKQYRLGIIGTGTMSHDINRWFHRIRGKEDPYAKVGVSNDRAVEGGDYVWALKDITLEIKQGEVLGVIGKNGAGKSTLLKLLSKITSPTEGVIKVNGRMATLLEVGTGFHPELTGRENIYLNGAILGMTKVEIRSKIDDIVDFSGCAKYVDTPVKRYSSGMRVRLGFAVAAFLDPDILVVDEVLAVGDAEFQKQAIGKMKDVSQTGGRTVLFVSHNMASIRSLCTRSVVLEQGKIVYDGNTNDAIQYYLESNRIDTDVHLKDRTDRLGNQKLKFTNVTCFRKGVETDEFISGDAVEFEIDYLLSGVINVNRFVLSIIFWDKQEQRVLSYSSDEMDCNFDNLNSKNKIRLVIPRFDIRGGLYDLKLVAAEGGTKMEDMLDNIAAAKTITVLPGDLWGIGKANREGSMAILKGSMSNV